MGRAFCFGDDIDTDQIIPAKHLTTADPTELAEHCLSGTDQSFAECVEPGDILVAGENFGSGSSREHAALAISGTGVDAVVAESFARIFFRNAINVGLPVLTVENVTEHVNDGETVTVSLTAGTIRNESTGRTLSSEGHPAFINEIIDQGGLIEYGNTLDPDEESARNR